MHSYTKWLPYLAFVATAAGTVCGFLFKTKAVEALVNKQLTRLFSRFEPQEVPAVVLSKAQWQEIRASGLVGLQTLLLYIQKEYSADRVTLTEYEEKEDGSHWATIVTEVREAEMPSILGQWKGVKLVDGMWEAVQRINQMPHRWRFVEDARFEDVEVVKNALCSSGVYSAFFLSLPTSTGKPSAMLTLSWHTWHTLTAERVGNLLLSGHACALLRLFMEKMTAPAVPSPSA